ncbi:MAG: hypothetical protein H8E12_14700 [Rhodobacteraceae bacterium]|nr:hypothetical protein [Paracoccaceae bacterium]
MRKELTDFGLVHVGANGQVTFSLSNLGQTVTGIDLLTQTILKRILTLPGSDLYFPTIGTHLGGLFGAVTREDIEDAKSMFPLLLKNLEETLITEQEGQEELLPSEKLSRIELKDLIYDEGLLG